MPEGRSLSRGSFLRAALASGALATAGSLPAVAAGARSGDWCRPLTKFAREDAYDFSLYLLDGKDDVFTLSDYVGRPVWLQFFATWCGPCNNEAADIVRIAAKYGEAVKTVGIDVDEHAPDVRAFRERHKITFPLALDDGGKVFKALGFHSYPTHMFLDARGMVSCISIGDLTPQEMDNEIAVALARQSATPIKAIGSPAP